MRRLVKVSCGGLGPQRLDIGPRRMAQILPACLERVGSRENGPPGVVSSVSRGDDV